MGISLAVPLPPSSATRSCVRGGSIGRGGRGRHRQWRELHRQGREGASPARERASSARPGEVRCQEQLLLQEAAIVSLTSVHTIFVLPQVVAQVYLFKQFQGHCLTLSDCSLLCLVCRANALLVSHLWRMTASRVKPLKPLEQKRLHSRVLDTMCSSSYRLGLQSWLS